jgi:hypothetical protein
MMIRVLLLFPLSVCPPLAVLQALAGRSRAAQARWAGKKGKKTIRLRLKKDEFDFKVHEVKI